MQQSGQQQQQLECPVCAFQLGAPLYFPAGQCGRRAHTGWHHARRLCEFISSWCTALEPMRHCPVAGCYCCRPTVDQCKPAKAAAWPDFCKEHGASVG
eukprot:1160061-Pelagomonas_calceolata.AAC.4